MKREFKVGDICRIRQWDDMANEFGVQKTHFNLEYIQCKAVRFTSNMKYLCGKIFTIKRVRYNKYYASEEGIEKGSIERNINGGWFITNDMLEYAYPEPETDEDSDFTLNLADLFE